MSTAAIEVIDLVKVFKRHRALDGVTFAIPSGQVCALLGPNGAGKTTTIHTLLGLTTPTSGTVRILGHDVTRARSAALRRTNFMASYGHFPWRMSVREVLRVYAELYEVDSPRTAIADAVEAVGIGDLLGQLNQTLSSGQQTLVALAKALLNRPAVLFLDEPTASLDPEHATQIREVLREVVTRQQTTVLVTSHNMPEIERLADRVLFLSQGRLLADGTVADLRDRFRAADLEEVFLQVAKHGRAT
ncbi:MAG: ABC transporter ATP-binding protein [Egibacteraceae bacterium]